MWATAETYNDQEIVTLRVQDTPEKGPTTHPTLFICFFHQPWLCPSYGTRLCTDTRDIRHLTEDNTSSFKASLCPQPGCCVLSKTRAFSQVGREMQPLHAGCWLRCMLFSCTSSLRCTFPVFLPLIIAILPFPSDTHSPPVPETPG